MRIFKLNIPELVGFKTLKINCQLPRESHSKSGHSSRLWNQEHPRLMEGTLSAGIREPFKYQILGLIFFPTETVTSILNLIYQRDCRT